MSTTPIPDNTTSSSSSPNYTLSYAHGTVMIIAWMLFGSTGILFARYGRSLHIGRQVKILRELIWFQIHRFALCTTAIATLLGFFLILAQNQGQWASITDGGHIFAHSILGGMIVCCAQIQVWMALFRCHPDSRFRFIFNWMHRLTGLFAFILSVPTIFLITFVLQDYQNGLITILSLWSAWVVIIVIIFEIIEYRSRKTSALSTDNQRKYELTTANSSESIEIDRIDDANMPNFSKIKLFLFSLHIIIAIGLVIPLITLIWLQT
jgi:hypothetical protein